MKPNFLPLILVAVMGVSGCAGLSERPAPAADTSAADPVLLALSEAAEEVAASWRRYGALEQARDPGFGQGTALPDLEESAPLARRLTLEWAGELSRLAREMASRAGWVFRETGRAPANPVMVFVRAEDTPMVEILRDAGLQAGRRAGVLIHADHRIIEVAYAPE